jgi:thiazole synthase
MAVSADPVKISIAFKMAVEAGRMAFEAKMGKSVKQAVASSPLTAFLDEI